jgi:hypothetical protein
MANEQIKDMKVVKTEMYDVDTMEALAVHDGVSQQVKKMLNSYKRLRVNGNTVQVVYEYGKKLKKARLGRLYPQRGLGLQNFPSDIRSALAQKYYWDIDMVNSQPVLLSQMAEKNGWKCDHLKDYVAHRADKLNEIMEMLDCDRSDAKTMCIAVMFGGKYKKAPPFILELQKELEQLAMNIVNAHPDFQKALKGEDAKTIVAHVLQHQEFQLLKFIDAKMDEYGRSMDVYIHDGGCVRRLEGEAEFPPALLRQLEKDVMGEFGYSIRLEVKAMNHSFKFKEEKRRFIQSDKDAVDLLYKEVKHLIVYSKGTHYYRVGLLWTSDTETMDSHMRQYIMEANLWKRGGTDDKPYSSEFHHSSQLITLIKEQAIQHRDDGWIVGVGVKNKGKILYQNGYYDLSRGEFFPPNHPHFDTSIVFLESVPYAWSSELLDETYQASIMDRFFLQQHDDVKGKFLARVLARGIAGDAMKHFAIGTGSGNTGKSFLAKTMGVVFGGYVGTFNGANLIYKPGCSQDEAQRNRWIGLLQNKRVVFSSELRMDRNALDGNMMKTLSSGGHDPIVARGHAQNEREIPWRALCFLLANDMGRIHPVDEPLMKRILYFSYEKQYVDEVDEKNPYQLKMDRELEKEIMTPRFKMNYAHLLFRAYFSWVTGGEREEIPKEMEEDRKELVSETCPVQRFLDYGFVITDDEKDCIPSSTIQRWMDDEKVGVSMTKFGQEMNKHVKLKGYQNVESKNKKVAGKASKHWFGIKEDTTTNS